MAPLGVSPHQCQALSGVSRRRLLGTYYTPDDLATVLVRWALADGKGPLLDPSYGGCAFLEAAVRILSEKDLARPETQVYGVDIDPGCTETVRLIEKLSDSNCIESDFLSVSPDELPGSPYAAIVGNPPYVRHHWISVGQRESARAAAAESTLNLPATASLWAYFLLHSLRFLSPGGRLAMLVPEAILQADYAAPLRRLLADKFTSSRLIHVRDRMFVGTDEAVVVAACSGFGGKGEIQTLCVESLGDLHSVLTASERGRPPSYRFPPGVGDTGREAVTLLGRIDGSSEVRRFGEVAAIRVGVVTGANQHFIRSRGDLNALGLPESVRHRIVSRTRWLRGLEFTEEDHDEFVNGKAAAFLVRPKDPDEDRLVQRWIREGFEEGIAERYKCSLRDDWFRVERPTPPDAFATCARTGWPLLVLNRAACQNSNAIHSVTWKPDFAGDPEAVAVGFLTSAVAAWAELSGRRYGGGVLKIEPGTLKSAPIPVVDGADDVFKVLDRSLRNGREQEARRIADDRVLREGIGLSDQEIECLRFVSSQLMDWRRPSRGNIGHG
ncbi:MAG: N-6 DNA methylase [Bryobacterales bacterium]|nr:N-6 DNA methylase [Bryobacterales bacterium]